MLLGLGVLLSAGACREKSKAGIVPGNERQSGTLIADIPPPEPPLLKITVERAIRIREFFRYIDQMVERYDTLTPYPLNEYLLLRANPWILDTLVRSDYYYQMSLGHFVYDQRSITVLHPGDSVLIPGPKTASLILHQIAETWLDVNIPAFEMRIMEGDSCLYTMPVRVGKNRKKYLGLAGATVDLRTRTGTGEIIRVNRDPLFIDPVSGKRFKFTKRDDQRITYMPLIPWLEPVVNGVRYGQMIHPTSNPKTLGKPASNGCIGVGEADGWRVYWFAPPGAKVLIRYDLQAVTPDGDTLFYEDVYHLKPARKSSVPLAVSGHVNGKTNHICLCDSIF